MSTEEEKQTKEEFALDKFRAITSDLEHDKNNDSRTMIDDKTLLRFLRARGLDVKKAENQLRKWRKENEIDALHLWDAPSCIKDDLVTYFTGFDKENRPVYFSQIGQWDIRPVLARGLKDDGLQYAAKCMELVMKVEDRVGSTQFITIMDVAGASLARVVHWGSIEFMIRLFHDFEAYYPETLYAAYVVNVPTIFWYAYEFVRPLFSKHTTDKIHIFDSDKNKWQNALMNDVPPNALSVECGGSVLRGIPVLDHKDFLEKHNFKKNMVASVLGKEPSVTP